LEIADILVVNKIDRPGAEQTVRALRAMLELGHPEGWLPPILQTVALERKGIPELVEQIDKHRAYLKQSGELQRRERTQLESELIERLRDALLAQLQAHLDSQAIADMLNRLVERQIDPIAAVHELLAAQGQH
jgi:LAO/AO transport system kinase